MTVIALDAGFPLTVQDTQLIFGEDVIIAETKTRTRGEIAPFASDAAACVPASAVQYWMYNGIAARADASSLRDCEAQYELTWLLPDALGAERAKTLGHIHNAPAPGSATYPEIYQVLFGRAYFLFYTLDATKMRAVFCGKISAHAGEQILMPPNTYHLTINAGDTPLLFADVISTRARGLYDDVRATRGAPYYALRDETWQRNPAFADAAPLVESPQMGADALTPLYTQFARDPGAFTWLNDLALFWEKFQVVRDRMGPDTRL